MFLGQRSIIYTIDDSRRGRTQHPVDLFRLDYMRKCGTTHALQFALDVNGDEVRNILT